jgi:DNA polymerase-3 subunit epsilon
LPPRVSDAEREAHQQFIATLGENALWREYRPDDAAASGA